MRPAGRRAALGVALAGALLAAGCGGAAQAPAGTGAAPPEPPLDTSLGTAAGTWAVVVMGGSAAQHNNFWQMFVRPAGGNAWKLVTPPGTADNGGLVVADDGGQSLITAFRPSQGLTYTPLIQTSNSGQAWSSLNPLDAALAAAPDALAVEPGTGRLLALTTGGTVETATPGYNAWQVLGSARTLSATPAGRGCGPLSLAAATFTSSGTPLVAGACAHPGIAGIFAYQDGTWESVAPPIPAGLARQDVAVAGMAQTRSGIVALLATPSSLLAAWLADDGAPWTVSSPLRLGSGSLGAASFGPDGTAAVVLPGDRGETIARGASWQPLPTLPQGTATLASAPGGEVDALAVHGGKLTVWQARPGGAAWSPTQTIQVAIPYGSSS
jgi:hypothetical protein